jgi:GSH-dependent disulfide-bond oxidoreductase
MIDFYALTSPNVIKVFIMLQECELPYTLKLVDVWKAEQWNPEFLKVNPNAKVPAIVDHDGPGGQPYTVIESGAILMYLSDKAGKFLPKEPRAHYDTLQWMMVQMTSVGPMFGQWNHFTRFAKEGNAYAISRYTSEMLRLYELFDKRLGDTGAYLGGSDYSIADVATFPWMRSYAAHGATAENHPHLVRWVDAIAARPAVKRALDEIGTIKSARDNATPDALDRFFNRGKYARA